MKAVSLQRQRGITLVVALVMLVLITLLALTTFNLGKTGMQVVGNMQARDEGIAASRQVIDEVLSSTRFFDAPTDAIASKCGDSNTRCVDTNGDGTSDIKVELKPAPKCIMARSIQNSELDFTITEDQGCILGARNPGIQGAGGGDSMCADSTWELTAVATDSHTETKVEVVQGVAVRVPKDDVDTSCP